MLLSSEPEARELSMYIILTTAVLERVSRQAKELLVGTLLVLLMMIILTAVVEVNVSISFSFVKIRILTLILASKFGF